MLFDTVTIAGVGLIGGSIGLAIRERGLARRVIGVGRSRATLQLALQRGILDEIGNRESAFPRSDLIILATPVDRIPDDAREAASLAGRDLLITDAGSTKSRIVRSLESPPLPTHVSFVGSHPLAGSEKRGPEYAQADLFRNRVTVVTPVAGTPPEALERIRGFWTAIGSRVLVMSPEEHDDALALTSHLPHLLASALARILPESRFPLAATGFRDTTRIAAGDPALWTAIFQDNLSAVCQALQGFEDSLAEFRQALEDGDFSRLTHLLSQGKQVRDALGS